MGGMGMRKITFEIPEEIAERFLEVVPPAEQSGEVSRLLERRATQPLLSEADWDAAADAANGDAALNADIDTWQALSDPMEEPWNAPSPR